MLTVQTFQSFAEIPNDRKARQEIVDVECARGDVNGCLYETCIAERVVCQVCGADHGSFAGSPKHLRMQSVYEVCLHAKLSELDDGVWVRPSGLWPAVQLNPARVWQVGMGIGAHERNGGNAALTSIAE